MNEAGEKIQCDFENCPGLWRENFGTSFPWNANSELAPEAHFLRELCRSRKSVKAPPSLINMHRENDSVGVGVGEAVTAALWGHRAPETI